MLVHGVPVLGALGVMLLVGLVLPALSSPISLAYGALATLGVTMLKDRRLAVTAAVAAVVALALVLWATGQPGYVELGPRI